MERTYTDEIRSEIRCPVATPFILEELTREFSKSAALHDLEDTVARENFELLHKHRLLALTVPSNRGGRDAGLREISTLIEAIGKGEPATGLIAIMQYFAHRFALQGPHVSPDSDAICRQVQREAVENGALINCLRVEPALGSPQRGGLPETIACRSGEGWRLSGRKIYSTGAPVLTWMLVFARTDEAEVRTGNFLVSAQTPGVRIENSWNHVGLRASGSHDVVFEDAALPFDHAIDLQSHNSPGAFLQPADANDRGLDEQMSWLSVMLSSLYNGVAVAARDWVVRYLTQRTPTNLGAPLSSLPRFQEAVGKIDSLLLTNGSLIERLSKSADAGQPLPAAQAGLIKFTVMGNVLEAVHSAIALTGNPGLSRANPLERHFRDALCGRVHAPQPDSALQFAGRSAFNAVSPH